MKQFCKIHFAFLLIATVLLSGCAKKTPTEAMIDTHIDHIGQVLDYSYNNFDQNAEVLQLENELSNCQMVLSDVKKSHKLEISGCESNTSYWKLAAISLFIALCGAIFIILRKVIL